MKDSLPQTSVSPLPAQWDRGSDPSKWPWHEIAPLPPFLLADGREPAQQQTTVRLCHDGANLYVHFTCEDRDIWGTYSQRDDPIYDEEVVEIFLAPGSSDPVNYAELEISPNGVLLDAWITNPTGERADLQADFDWDCAGIVWQADREDERNCWSAIIIIPLGALDPDDKAPTQWRANFYRIERPRGGSPEFSCWSPTMAVPADFHKPTYFGRLDLV